MAHALVFQSPPQWLEKHLDLPWQARGDLYYLHKLVATLDAYGAAAGRPWRARRRAARAAPGRAGVAAGSGRRRAMAPLNLSRKYER